MFNDMDQQDRIEGVLTLQIVESLHSHFCIQILHRELQKLPAGIDTLRLKSRFLEYLDRAADSGTDFQQATTRLQLRSDLITDPFSVVPGSHNSTSTGCALAVVGLSVIFRIERRQLPFGRKYGMPHQTTLLAGNGGQGLTMSICG